MLHNRATLSPREQLPGAVAIGETRRGGFGIHPDKFAADVFEGAGGRFRFANLHTGARGAGS